MVPFFRQDSKPAAASDDEEEEDAAPVPRLYHRMSESDGMPRLSGFAGKEAFRHNRLLRQNVPTTLPSSTGGRVNSLIQASNC